MAFTQAITRIRVAFFVLIRLIYVDPQLLVDQVAKILRWPRSPQSYLQFRIFTVVKCQNLGDKLRLGILIEC